MLELPIPVSKTTRFYINVASVFHSTSNAAGNNPMASGQEVRSVRRLQRKTLSWDLPDFFGLGSICIEPATSRHSLTDPFWPTETRIVNGYNWKMA